MKQLPERAQLLLHALIENHIREGQPVGSRTLSKSSGLSLSPASIRNILADLEEMGLVASPHTSAGRVPTTKGYRLFVDSILQVKARDSQEIRLLKQQLDPENSVENLLETASKLVSELTQMAGIVTLPKRERIILKHIELLKLPSQRLLVILVLDDGEVRNCVIEAKKSYTPAQLERMGRFITEKFAGKDLETIRRELVDELKKAQENLNQQMQEMVNMANQAISAGLPEDNYYLSGQTNLMGFHELSEIDQLKQLFETFGRKREILELMDQCLNSDDIRIFIGEESGYAVLDRCSVIASPYHGGDTTIGVLGVIGPSRMDYYKAIPLVDATSRILSRVLEQKRH
ncbi:MAG: heat-inducible transcription repressor HrcA [Gammaproteobacteria bacterium]|nr:MAG: heat-inducible transcription repressor HrcA [Gammaproteobacteria bacterium]